MSNAPRVARTIVTTFSEVELTRAAARTIVVFARAGDAPAIGVTVYHRGGAFTRTLFHTGAELDALEAAVRYARDAKSRGRRDIAQLPHGDDLVVNVWAEAARGDRLPARVAFGRKLADGRFVSRGTSMAGDELDGLERAIEFARSVHRGS